MKRGGFMGEMDVGSEERGRIGDGGDDEGGC